MVGSHCGVPGPASMCTWLRQGTSALLWIYAASVLGCRPSLQFTTACALAGQLQVTRDHGQILGRENPPKTLRRSLMKAHPEPLLKRKQKNITGQRPLRLLFQYKLRVLVTGWSSP